MTVSEFLVAFPVTSYDDADDDDSRGDRRYRGSRTDCTPPNSRPLVSKNIKRESVATWPRLLDRSFVARGAVPEGCRL